MGGFYGGRLSSSFSTCLWRLGIMLPTQDDLISGDFHAEARPTEEMTERTIKLEGDRLSNGEIIWGLSGFLCSDMSHHLSFLWLASITFRKKYSSSGSP